MRIVALFLSLQRSAVLDNSIQELLILLSQILIESELHRVGPRVYLLVQLLEEFLALILGLSPGKLNLLEQLPVLFIQLSSQSFLDVLDPDRERLERHFALLARNSRSFEWGIPSTSIRHEMSSWRLLAHNRRRYSSFGFLLLRRDSTIRLFVLCVVGLLKSTSCYLRNLFAAGFLL